MHATHMMGKLLNEFFILLEPVCMPDESFLASFILLESASCIFNVRKIKSTTNKLHALIYRTQNGHSFLFLKPFS